MGRGHNGGFSDAPEELLYAKPIDDRLRYKAVNVAAQELTRKVCSTACAI